MNQLETLRNKKSVSDWLTAAGIACAADILEIASGGNNRVYKVSGETGTFLLKQYFFHPMDKRNRLKAEFDFLSYIWKRGIRVVPQPISCNEENHLGLYEFVSGTSFIPGSVSRDDLDMAQSFLLRLNEDRKNAISIVGNASEACFSVQAHLACVEERINKVTEIVGETPIDQEARTFVIEKLVPEWTRIKRFIQNEAAGWLEYSLKIGERCLSPSDFGFHNAIQQPNRGIRFIDFEYAGWDDPAKLVCDFFCQVKVPVDSEELAPFVEGISGMSDQPTFFSDRVHWLLPAYQIKWCCIVLNEFLPVSLLRRRFADGSGSDIARKQNQLEKAKQFLKRATSIGL